MSNSSSSEVRAPVHGLQFVNTDPRSGGEGENQGGSWSETALIVGAAPMSASCPREVRPRDCFVGRVPGTPRSPAPCTRGTALGTQRARRQGEAVAESEDAQGVAAVGPGVGNAGRRRRLRRRLQAEARVTEDAASSPRSLGDQAGRGRARARKEHDARAATWPRAQCMNGIDRSPRVHSMNRGAASRAAYALATAASRNARARSTPNPAEPDRAPSVGAVSEQSSRGVVDHTGFTTAQLQEQLRDVARAQWANVPRA